jgi:hypothetical protein
LLATQFNRAAVSAFTYNDDSYWRVVVLVVVKATFFIGAGAACYVWDWYWSSYFTAFSSKAAFQAVTWYFQVE